MNIVDDKVKILMESGEMKTSDVLLNILKKIINYSLIVLKMSD